MTKQFLSRVLRGRSKNCNQRSPFPALLHRTPKITSDLLFRNDNNPFFLPVHIIAAVSSVSLLEVPLEYVRHVKISCPSFADFTDVLLFVLMAAITLDWTDVCASVTFTKDIQLLEEIILFFFFFPTRFGISPRMVILQATSI